MSSKKRKENKTKTAKKQKWMFDFMIAYSMKTGSGRNYRQKMLKDGHNRIGKSGNGFWEWEKNL